MMQSYKKGFTIVELALSMTFISVLLLSIVTVSIQLGKTYNRGIIIKEVNQAGYNISRTLKRDFLTTDHRQVSGGGGDAVITLNDAGGVVSGRFCLGYYAYLWNTPETIDGGIKSPNVVVDTSGDPISFVRVVDAKNLLCRPDDVTGKYRTTLEDSDEVTNLLQSKVSFDNNAILAVHSIDVTPIVLSEGEAEGLYKVSFTVGTSSLKEINTTDQSCKPPEDEDSNLNFCSINKFDIIVRTNG